MILTYEVLHLKPYKCTYKTSSRTSINMAVLQTCILQIEETLDRIQAGVTKMSGAGEKAGHAVMYASSLGEHCPQCHHPVKIPCSDGVKYVSTVLAKSM